MDYGIGRAHKLKKKTESELKTTQVLLQNLQLLNIVMTS